MTEETRDLIRKEISELWDGSRTIVSAVDEFNTKRAKVYGAFVESWSGSNPIILVIDLVTDEPVKIEIER